MKYGLTLVPQGVIPPDLRMGVVLQDIPEPEPAPADTGATPVDPNHCDETTIGAWIVENVSIQNSSGGIKTAVAPGVDGAVQRVPFPNNCFYGNIRAAIGCLIGGECLEWAAETNDPGTTVTLFPYNGTDAPGERCDGISFVVQAPGDPAYDFSAVEVTIQALAAGAVPVGPPIVSYCDPLLYSYAFGGWCTQHVDNAAVACEPTANEGPTPVQCTDVTIAQVSSGGCHIDITTIGAGNVAWYKPADINWTVTQLSGSATVPSVILGACGHWHFTPIDGEDYSGNSFQLDADIAAVPFGTPLVISCEV